jgi:hypothetical protein
MIVQRYRIIQDRDGRYHAQTKGFWPWWYTLSYVDSSRYYGYEFQSSAQGHIDMHKAAMAAEWNKLSLPKKRVISEDVLELK